MSICHKLKCSNPYIFAHDDVNLWYFKLRLFNLTNLEVLRQRVAKIQWLENQSLWQRLNSLLRLRSSQEESRENTLLCKIAIQIIHGNQITIYIFIVIKLNVCINYTDLDCDRADIYFNQIRMFNISKKYYFNEENLFICSIELTQIPCGEFSCFTWNYPVPISLISQQFGQKKTG